MLIILLFRLRFRKSLKRNLKLILQLFFYIAPCSLAFSPPNFKCALPVKYEISGSLNFDLFHVTSVRPHTVLEVPSLGPWSEELFRQTAKSSAITSLVHFLSWIIFPCYLWSNIWKIYILYSFSINSCL